jgi:hypothetical protein
MSRVKIGRSPRAANKSAAEPVERVVRKTLARVLAHSRQMQGCLEERLNRRPSAASLQLRRFPSNFRNNVSKVRVTSPVSTAVPRPQAPIVSQSGQVSGHVLFMLFPSLANFIFAFFSIFISPDVAQRPSVPSRNTLNFQLRHLHAVTPSTQVYFADVPPHSSLHINTQPLSIPISPVRTVRPQSAAAFAEARALSMRGQSATLDWEEDEIPGPDVSKRETLLLLAKMTSNAYVEPNTDGWYNLTDEWDIVRHPTPLHVTYFCG